MEVHAHSHPSSVGTRKKWTHYFWEFLMLFLAVFCGFLAENQREHFIEHKREKQFMRSLVKDLESDTLQLNRIRRYRINKLRKIDSLIIFFVRQSSVSVPLAGYTLSMDLYGHVAFFQSSGTLDQLKNSGGLRLIRRRNVVDSIESYDQQIRRMRLRDQYESDAMLYNSNLVHKVFDGKALSRIYADTVYYHKEAPSPESTVMVNPLYIDEYLNNTRTWSRLVDNNMAVQDQIKEKARLLLALIKTEYHLK